MTDALKSIEKLELRLRESSPLEREFIDALKAEEATYGGKNTLMRECLERGYLLFKKQVDQISDAGKDRVSRLNALSEAFPGGYQGFRVLKTYLSSLTENAALAPSAVAVAVSASPVEVIPDQTESVKNEVFQAESGGVVAMKADGVEGGVSGEVISSINQEVGQEAQDDPVSAIANTGVVDAGERQQVSANAVRWKSFRGLAGSTDSD